MSNDPERTIAELEKRITRLEYREGQIIDWLRHLGESDPWPSFILDHDPSPQQVDGIWGVLEQTYQVLHVGGAIEAKDFERQLLPHIPAKAKHFDDCAYDFIKGLLMTIARTGQWPGLPDHFREDFNVPPRS